MNRLIKFFFFYSTILLGFLATPHAQANNSPNHEKIILDDSGEIFLIQSKTGALLLVTNPLDGVVAKDGLEIRILDAANNLVMLKTVFTASYNLDLCTFFPGEYVIELKTTGYFKEFLLQI